MARFELLTQLGRQDEAGQMLDKPSACTPAIRTC